MFPVFFATMPITSIPKSAINPTVCFVGLIKEASPDFNAFAPSDALIPPSLIAVMYKAKSSMLPPSCCITGPAFGIASTKSLRVVDVWFSTALRKLIDSVSCSVFCLNAV